MSTARTISRAATCSSSPLMPDIPATGPALGCGFFAAFVAAHASENQRRGRARCNVYRLAAVGQPVLGKAAVLGVAAKLGPAATRFSAPPGRAHNAHRLSTATAMPTPLLA